MSESPGSYNLHGISWEDPLHWLRDKTNPKVLAHLEAENARTAASLAPLKELEEPLYQEMLGRIQQTDLSVPVADGPYLYFTRTEEGKQYARYCRSPRQGGAEEVYLDANVLATGHAYFNLGVIEVSPNHELLALSTDTQGAEDYVLQVKNLKTGETLTDRIERTYYAVEWAADNQTLFYNVLDDARRPYQVYRRKLGGESELVFQEDDQRFTLNPYKTRSGRYVMLDSSSSVTSEIRILDAERPQEQPRVFLPRRQGIEYSLTHQGDYFYLTINDTGRNCRLVRVPVENWDETAWEEVIPHRSDVYLEGVSAFRHVLVVTEREGGLRRFRYRIGEGEWLTIPLGQEAYGAGLGNNPDYEAMHVRYHFQSPLTPPSVYDFHIDTGVSELRKQTVIPSGFDAGAYVVRRLQARSHDGVAVPLILFHRKDLEAGRSHPTLLYGYGAYGHNSDAGFSGSRLSLVDRGVVYAIAQVRGGSEMGKPWHDAGKMMQKRNSFLDFIACAEMLIQEGVTTPKQLIIEGGSAGGLLVGAAVTMRPDLFGGVLAHVPFVDVVHTMLDATLPLTVGEYEEWGNPAEAEAFQYIRSYSPYENTGAAKYPQMLVTAGLNDPRVSYWEPAKWVLRLRENNRETAEILLKVNMGAGHFGASGRYDRLREVATEYAWLLRAFGLV
jgi:oligopeptidase B